MNRLQEAKDQWAAKSKEVGQIAIDKPDYNWTPDEHSAWKEGQKALTTLWDEVQRLTEIEAAAEANRKRDETLSRPAAGQPGHSDGSQPGQKSDDEVWGRARAALITGQPLPINDLASLATTMSEHEYRQVQTGRKSLQDIVFGRKSIGESFVASESYKAFAQNTRQSNMKAYTEVPELGFKATFTTGTATVTGYDRPPGLIMLGTQRLTVADLLASGQTTQNTVRYVKEDTFTNAATTVAEGAQKPEATFDTSEVDAPVRKIAVYARVTDEIFADFPMMRDYVNERLRFMVEQHEEAQLISGNGVGQNITGLLNAGIQTEAFATNELRTIYAAITKVRAVGYFEPTGYVTHPNNWATLRVLQTADGALLWGPPQEMGIERVFGLPVVVTTGITPGTSLVGAFKLGAQVWRREGVRVEATNSNEDDFEKNLITIRAEERLALAVYRPLAFCSCTSMP